MKRHSALIPLTHDHHHALTQVRKLRLAAKGTDDDRLGKAKQFLDFFHTDTLKHFREEEEVIFPFVADVAEAREALERVMIQHLQIHSLVHSLKGEVEEGISRPETLLRIAGRLEEHIRFEEKVVFPLIESIVGADLGSVTLAPRERAAG